MVNLRATDATDEIAPNESEISIAESGKVILDFVHIDGEEHTVVMPRETAMQVANGILNHLEDG